MFRALLVLVEKPNTFASLLSFYKPTLLVISSPLNRVCIRKINFNYDKLLEVSNSR